MKPQEMWGSIDSTLNRIGDQFISQLEKSGHAKRKNDLEIFQRIGIQKIFYPCLWEQVAPKDLDHCDWSFLDERLNELKRLKFPFVANLLHHGSGPQYTSLIDPDFPEKFATYARLFATRFPWVNEYTPIQEITHTARFSCLEGHWYPQLRSEVYYLKAIIHQCKATVLAMKAIKEINPHARLIQTENLGTYQSSAVLKELADFENHRQWLALDLLTGKMVKTHRLYDYLIQQGIREEELKWFEDNSHAPDILGINHTLSSNRFLDDEINMYPDWTQRVYQSQKYSDVAAVDTGKIETPMFGTIFKESWQRYHIPLVLMGSHILAEREAQMRWLNCLWQVAEDLNKQGMHVEAVSASNLLGTFAWHDGETFYQPGVFELHHNTVELRPTGLAYLIQELATQGYSHAPILKSESTWETSRRVQWAGQDGDFIRFYHRSDVQPILIIGATGILAQAIASVCGERNIHNRLLRRQDMDITDKDSIQESIDLYKPWAVINAAGFIHIDDTSPIKDFQGGLAGAIKLAEACADRNIALVNFSSDLVFNQHSNAAYVECNVVAPVTISESSEVETENHVLDAHPDALIIRTSKVLGPEDEYKALASNTVTESTLSELAHHCIDLLIDGEKGIINLLKDGYLTSQKFSDTASETLKEKLLLSSEVPHLMHRRKISVHKDETQVSHQNKHQAVFRRLFDHHLPNDSEQELFQ